MFYYKNGNILDIGNSNSDGKRTGKRKSYYENGQINLIVTWSNGVSEGDTIAYYEKGNMLANSKMISCTVKEQCIMPTEPNMQLFRLTMSRNNCIRFLLNKCTACIPLSLSYKFFLLLI